jgi:hypothetical protein
VPVDKESRNMMLGEGSGRRDRVSEFIAWPVMALEGLISEAAASTFTTSSILPTSRLTSCREISVILTGIPCTTAFLKLGAVISSRYVPGGSKVTE